uniref:Uncharacterized protein n=1 Tax=Tanacetum cinerariifolium TaxID=118510 RepID=A0A6L2N4N9_TANCI|nr:hypothetical protein [Tanacetum cinerariifolium]GFA17446.1 hypothetical protein [Tanacetum cinerariifolium]
MKQKIHVDVEASIFEVAGEEQVQVSCGQQVQVSCGEQVKVDVEEQNENKIGEQVEYKDEAIISGYDSQYNGDSSENGRINDDEDFLINEETK